MTDENNPLRECPSPIDGREPLIAHQISPETCGDRQGKRYHKCPACLHAGAASDPVVPSLPPLPRGARVEAAAPAPETPAKVLRSVPKHATRSS